MSWLNFNDSLNSIKGQISNFASGVLTEDVASDQDLSSNTKKIENLEEFVATQTHEIEILRKQNEELQGKLSKRQSSLNGVETGDHEKRDDWFWDPYGSDQVDNENKSSDLVAELKKKIADLETEKNELVISLEQLDLDCQQTTEKIVNLKDALQTDYNKLKLDFRNLKQENENLLSSSAQNLQIIQQLQREKHDLQNTAGAPPTSVNEESKGRFIELEKATESLNSEVGDLENLCAALRNENEKIREERDENLEELIRIKEALQTAVIEKNDLAKEVEEFKTIKKDCDLKLKEHEYSHLANQEEYNKLALILQGYEQQVRTCKKQYQVLQAENDILKESSSQKPDDTSKHEEAVILNDLIKELKRKNEIILKEKEMMHGRYVNLITESFKKFMDYDLVVEEKDVIPDNNPQISEFITSIEVILKLLLDLKWKTETLEKEVDDLTEEKTKILTDKNYEIEKLLSNSEILSQEVITKSQALKHYEAECSELIKNNDLLILELNNYKSNSGLQTISESNEDNLLLLESQLDNANKRIRDLELTISDLENSRQDANMEVQSELEYIKKQLNLTGTELSQSKHEYQELLQKFTQQEVEYKNLQNDFKELKGSYDECCSDKQNLNSTVDKIQSEFENTEYRYSEINVYMESLKEETETLTAQIDDLTKTNGKLEMRSEYYESKSELLQNEVDDLKQQLTGELETREQHELQIRNFTEKLQSAKMSETGLRLQNDTIHKELQNVIEAKNNLDVKCKQLTNELGESETNVKRLQEENVSLKQKYARIENSTVESERLLKEIEEITSKLNNAQEKVLFYEEQLKNQEELVRINKELLGNLEVSEQKIAELQKSKKELLDNITVSEQEIAELKKSVSEDNAVIVQQYEDKIIATEKANVDLKNTVQELNLQLANVKQENTTLHHQLEDSNKGDLQLNEYIQKVQSLQSLVNDLSTSRNDLINLITTKHQESIQYHNEIQRLNQVLAMEADKCKTYEQQLKNIKDKSETSQETARKNEEVAKRYEEVTYKNEEIEKLTDQNNFLREKCEVLAQNLLQEQSAVQKVLSTKSSVASEKEAALAKELERLRVHLLEIEEMYTKELLLAETKNQEMQAKVNEIEQREKDSSTLYTSVNIRSNQQVETLQTQLQLVTNQRDDLRKNISDAEDQISKQAAALSNLQFVLEQFQKDKEKDVHHETERIRRQINVEKQVQRELHSEIANLKAQLAESKQGLLAASRLTEQLESSRQQIANMKEEVSRLQQKLAKSEEKYDSLISHTDAKVDKMLIKNLIVGFVSANTNFNKDQHQILKLIATVLDFNQQDNEKVNLNKQQQVSWLSSILHPQNLNSDSHISHEESLSQAFVRFLENESKPRQLPNLLDSANPSAGSKAGENSARQSPKLLSEVVLPTFTDFAQNRNSSSILKDVLKDNN